MPQLPYPRLMKLKIPRILGKTLGLSSFCSKCGNNDKTLKEEESIKILKILGLINNIHV